MKTAASTTCALSSGGGVWCFGDDMLGEVGDGPGDSTGEPPTQVCL